MPQNQPVKAPAGIRLYLGLFFFALSWLLPLTAFVIANSKLAAATKGVLIGVVTVGAPELLALISIAILGKECFEFMKSKAFGMLKKLKPQNQVSKLRYRIGLFLFVLPLITWYPLAYAPQILPLNSDLRLAICLVSDICFWSSLFVLGGDFWDKLRALFIYEAKIVLPPAVSLPIEEKADEEFRQ